MKTNWKSGLALFCGAATVSMCTLYPLISDAAWRQYSPTGCSIRGEQPPAFEGQPSLPRAGINSGEVVNWTVAPTNPSAWPNLDHVPFECPIVEDESVHVKGGATLKLILETYLSNWGTRFFVCANFQNAVGATCTGQQDTDSSPTIKTYSVTPGASVWTTGTHFGYLYVNLGSRMQGGSTPSNKLKGYWVSTP